MGVMRSESHGAAEVKIVQVSLFGQTYSLMADEEPETLRKIAAYVDARMQDVAGQLSSASLSKVAILASLNIAKELFAVRDQVKEDQQAQVKFYTDLLRMIDLQHPELNPQFTSSTSFVRPLGSAASVTASGSRRAGG